MVGCQVTGWVLVPGAECGPAAAAWGNRLFKMPIFMLNNDVVQLVWAFCARNGGRRFIKFKNIGCGDVLIFQPAAAGWWSDAS